MTVSGSFNADTMSVMSLINQINQGKQGNKIKKPGFFAPDVWSTSSTSASPQDPAMADIANLMKALQGGSLDDMLNYIEQSKKVTKKPPSVDFPSDIVAYAKQAAQKLDKATQSDSYYLGMPKVAEIKFIQNRKGMPKEQYAETLNVLAQNDLAGNDLNGDGVVEVQEYVDSQYQKTLEGYKKLYASGAIINEEVYNMYLKSVDKTAIAKLATTIDFSYDAQGNVIDKVNGILEEQDVAAFFGRVDSRGGKYDGVFTTAQLDGEIVGAVDDSKSAGVRKSLFEHHKELFDK